MRSLVDKYQPKTLSAFAGLDRTRKILECFSAEPYNSAWLFLGPAGTGKTSMAFALAKEIGAEPHHVPSRNCDKAAVDAIAHTCWFVPFVGKWHVVIVDEADQMTRAAQLAFLSKLDGTASPPNTVFIFTANETELLEKRFLSRCRTLKFDHDSDPRAAVAFLERVWSVEARGAAIPDVRQILESNGYNLRDALMQLELEMTVASAIPDVPDAPAPSAAPRDTPVTTAGVGELLNAVAVSRLLNINQATVYNRVKQGKLPQPQAVGRAMMWHRSELVAAEVR
jgi:DNA polymerase III gamma/tau subunit/predicted DNA-binding transcriptional regulator AlpA